MGQTQLSSEEQKVLAWIIILIGFVLAVLVFIITMARVVFWLSVILFFCSFLYLIVGGIMDIIRLKDGEEFDIGGFPHFILAIGLMIFFWSGAHFFFPIGYSELSYQILEWDKEYNEFIGLPYQVTIEALNQTCNSLPNYSSCNTFLTGYQTAKNVEEISGTAELIQIIFNLKFK